MAKERMLMHSRPKDFHFQVIPTFIAFDKNEINIGEETRQMVAGIADTYSPEELVGKKLTVIVNLKPAVIRGIESQAMLLAAEMPDRSAILAFFPEDIRVRDVQ